MLKVCNVKLSFDIWLILYMYFILYFQHTKVSDYLAVIILYLGQYCFTKLE